MDTWVGRSTGALMACFLLVSGAQAAGYNFRLIADTSGQFSALEFPRINADGTVAFQAELDAGGEGIYTGSGGPITTVADTTTAIDGGTFFRFRNPQINANGTVVFSALVTPAGGGRVEGVYTRNGGPITTVIENATSQFDGIGNSNISDNGTIVFNATIRFSSSNPFTSGIYTTTGGPVTTIADTTGPIERFDGPRPIINADGIVPFVAVTNLTEETIYTGTGGPLTTIIDTSGAFSSFANQMGINSSGKIAFVGDLDAGGSGLFVSDGETLTTILDPNDGDLLGPFLPSINDNDEVAFRARLTSGEGGIFVGDDPIADNVILAGDLLDGAVVDDVYVTYDQGLNNRGDIAFRATFEDGSQAIYVAFIPIPAAAWLFGSALGLLGWLRRRVG